MSAPANQVAPWEDFVLRLIGVYKIAKSLLFFSAGLGVRNLLHRDVSQFLNDYVVEYHIDPENRLLHRVVEWCLIHASSLTDHRIRLISYAAFFLAAIFALEGIGLYLRKHWAEYVVVVSTGLLLPVEFYELYLKLAWWKFGVLVGNLLIVGYLIHRILLDARMKAARLERNGCDVGERVASDLNGNHSAAGNRAGDSGPVSTKTR
jgi:uncharacterized membrane protein (DUF2068 family)